MFLYAVIIPFFATIFHEKCIFFAMLSLEVCIYKYIECLEGFFFLILNTKVIYTLVTGSCLFDMDYLAFTDAHCMQ